MSPSLIDDLLAAGKLSEAAELLEREGQHARAAELYEQLWDFPSAMRAARAGGDLPRALRAALEGRLSSAVDDLIGEAAAASPETARVAAATCAERSAWPHAARLYQAAGSLWEASECYLRAGHKLEAASVLEGLGELARAAELYRDHLDLGESAEDAGSLDARYRLGRLMVKLGRNEEALPLLQRVWRESGPDSQQAGRAVVAALHRLGHPAAAESALALLACSADGETVSVQSCAADPELTPIGQAEGTQPALAGRYRLGRLLGSGGMGRVYLAIDLLTGEDVAVKVFSPPGGARGRDAYRRFIREARTTGQLQHPHIVSVLDFDEEMGFQVLEHMAGGTLADRLRPRLDLPTTRSVLLQVVSGLAAAHQRGVVHRDIKPSNIFFSAAGAAKLGDFGVAHLQDAGQTQTGAFIGTVSFMAPEQISGDRVSFATDVYAIGVNLYLMLTGSLPFGPPDVVGQHLHSPPPRPSAVCAGLPQLCDELVARCMAKRPEERYGSLEQLRQALELLPQEQREELPLTSSGTQTGLVAAPPPSRRAADSRFSLEGTIWEQPDVQLLAARDTQLGRAVVLVRLAPGPTRARRLELLSSAAARGTESLQRVLALDQTRGWAVLESQAEPLRALPSPGSPESLVVAEQLGLALAPLHRAGVAHGAISAAAVVGSSGAIVLSLVPALTSADPGSASADVTAVLRLLALEPRDQPSDGETLASWAAAERARAELAAREERQRSVIARALAAAPAELVRR